MIHNMVGGGSGKLFAAISVTYPEGSTLTCTDGQKTLRAKTTNGLWLFATPYAGTWTVTATEGERTKSETVEITTEGQIASVELSYIQWLYDSGNEFTDITGGWGVDGYTADAGIYAATKANGYIDFVGVGNGYRAVGTLKAIDLTEKQTLYVDWQATGAVSTTSIDLYVTKTKQLTPVASVSFGAVGERRVDSIDISKISGEAFLLAVAGWSPSCTGRIYRVWVE